MGLVGLCIIYFIEKIALAYYYRLPSRYNYALPLQSAREL